LKGDILGTAGRLKGGPQCFGIRNLKQRRGREPKDIEDDMSPVAPFKETKKRFG